MDIKKDNNLNNTGDKQCNNCGTTRTPLWRKHGFYHYLCNACGLHYMRNGHHRPHFSEMSRVSTLRKSFYCANCGTDETTMWRRDARGFHVCNACGLFFRIHGYNRPVTMRRDVIRTRKRREKDPLQTQSEDSTNGDRNLDPFWMSSMISESEGTHNGGHNLLYTEVHNTVKPEPTVTRSSSSVPSSTLSLPSSSCNMHYNPCIFSDNDKHT